MHPVSDDPIAAPIDPGIPQRSFTEKDFEGELGSEIKSATSATNDFNLNFRPNQTKVSIYGQMTTRIILARLIFC